MARDNGQEALATIMLTQAIAGSGEQDPETKELLKFFLQEQIGKMKAAKERLENHKRSSIALAREIMERRKLIRQSCQHRKPYPSFASALAGQYLSNGQLMLICQICHSEFHNPPKKGSNQFPCPPHLIPQGISIGGTQAY